MQKIIIIIYALLLSLSVSAEEPVANLNKKPMVQLGGGKVIGTARIVGQSGQAVIISCDKSQKTCLYIIKKVFDDEPGIDMCGVMQPWPAPQAAQDRFDQNYPYAFSFDTQVLTFYPATKLSIDCPNEQGSVQITVTTEATIQQQP